MKISSIPKSGRKGSVVYLNTRYGKVAREYVRPSNPRTPEQQDHRNNVRAGRMSQKWPAPASPPLPHSTARPRRAVVAAPTAAGARMRTAAFPGAEIRNPNLETRNKLKFPIFQCP